MKGREPSGLAVMDSTHPTEPTEDENDVEKASGLGVPSLTARDWILELSSPTTDQLSGSVPVGSVQDEVQDIESRHARMDEEDAELYAFEQGEEGDDSRNAASLSEELLLGDEAELVSPQGMYTPAGFEHRWW